MPMAWGIFRASVLMPADADTWPAHRLRVVLLHELAHVKRRDCLTHVVAQIVCAAYWFNPLAWIAARRLRTERERACDDLVLAIGHARRRLRRRVARHRPRDTGAAIPGRHRRREPVAMAHRSQLEGRLMAILDPSVPRRGLTSARTAAAGAVFALLILRSPPCSRGRKRALSRTPPSLTRVQAQATAQASGSDRVATSVDVHVKRDVDTQVRVQSDDDHVSRVHGQRCGGRRRVRRHWKCCRDRSRERRRAVGGVGMAVGGVIDGVVDGVADGIVDSVLEGAAGHVQANRRIPTRTPIRIRTTRGDRDGRKAADPRAVAALMEALKDTDKDVRETAMHALVQMRDPRMFEPLVAALKDTSADVREQAVFGLGQLRDPRAVDPLTTVLHDSNADVRQQAVFALGQLRDKRSVDPLISALKDEKPTSAGRRRSPSARSATASGRGAGHGAEGQQRRRARAGGLRARPDRVTRAPSTA